MKSHTVNILVGLLFLLASVAAAATYRLTRFKRGTYYPVTVGLNTYPTLTGLHPSTSTKEKILSASQKTCYLPFEWDDSYQR